MGLAERRKALGYSQEKSAELLGVDRTTVGRWERSRPSHVNGQLWQAPWRSASKR
ncbi:helix-turn-helix transcriptional regulator [Streptomyces sp. NPDC001272]